MPIHESRLLRSEVVAEGTMAFYFARPANFNFKSGQNALFTLDHPAEIDAKGPSRTFSLASAPDESELMIATRMRDSAFKRALKDAAPGMALHIDGPGGDMVLHDDPARPAVFLAGGIGITPFLSMARDAAKRRLPHRITLLYSNRRREDAAFLDELQRHEGRNANYHLVATMTDSKASAQKWHGETAMLGRELVERHVPDLKAPIYYLAGPPGMTMAMQSMLEECGVADSDVRYEEFYGY
jgi:ferredoxin-NADP reductase